MKAAFISTFFRPSTLPTLRSFPLKCAGEELNRCRFIYSSEPLLNKWRLARHSSRTFCQTTTSQLDSTISSPSTTASSFTVLSSTDEGHSEPSSSTDGNESTSMFASDTSFTALGLSQATADRLQKCGLHMPTKAQAVVIPALMKGLHLQLEYAGKVRAGLQQAIDEQTEDGVEMDRQTQMEIEVNYEPEKRPEEDIDDVLMFAAETGSGKTLAYLAPFVEAAQQHPDVPLKAIVLLPTRELCNQVSSFIHAYFGGVKPESTNVVENMSFDDQEHLLPCARHVVLSGGESPYLSQSKGDVRIVLATPATLLQHLRMSEKATSMSDKYIVVDEADMLLQGAFLKDVERVLDQLGMKPFATRKNSEQRQRNANRLVFVGATFPHWVGTKVRSIVTWMKQRYPTMRAVQTPSVHRRSTRLNSRWYHLPSENDRLQTLQTILLSSSSSSSTDKVSDTTTISSDAPEEKVMVFCGKADTAVRVTEMLRNSNRIIEKYDGVAELHKLIPTPERKSNLRDFLNGKARIMVCTDLASRGLHLGHVERIIEFDFASNVVAYLHRIGRTARAGATGSTEHFYNDVSRPLAEAIREKAETEATVVESIFSRNRSFRRKLKKRMQNQQDEEREKDLESDQSLSAPTPVSLTDVEIDEMDEAERQRWNQ